jgi:endonuclease-3
MIREDVSKIMSLLKEEYNGVRRTSLNRMRTEGDSFKILIGCLVSIGIRDEVCEGILDELFVKAGSFEELLEIEDKKLERILYNARFRRIKANRLKEVSREILERFDGQVPDRKEDLLSIKGIGGKTANIVLNFAFDKNVIPVDSNVHRISNRLGIVETKTPDESEKMLLEVLPQKYWKEINGLCMIHGRETCIPINPKCDNCCVEKYCLKIELKNKNKSPLKN